MKKFIFKISLFVLLLVVSSSVFELITSQIILFNGNFTLKEQPKYLILGHSHPEHAFNDSIIDNLLNLAESGESYFYTYFKSKKIIETNSSISTVFIEFTNNSIDKKMDAWTWDCNYMGYRLDRFAPLISIKGKLNLLFENPKCYFNTMLNVSEERFYQVLNGDLSLPKKLGGFKAGFSSKEKATDYTQEELRVRDLNKFDKTSKQYSNLNIKYLEKLIRFCKDYNKEVVLIRTPQRNDYAFWANEIEFQKLRIQYFEEIPFIDFTKIDMIDDDYLDPAHLNLYGANRFSLWFNDMMESQEFDYYDSSKLDSLMLNFNSKNE